MCGIAGIVGEGDERKLQQMLQVQRHRGPDATSAYADAGYCRLGHNRLAIIDLSNEGNQPMSDASGRLTIVLNGEIYNYLELKNELSEYRFRSQSDTEVLLAAYLKWGRECLSKLIGMFSFAIWDAHTKQLFAARDRFGVKPFYYTWIKDQFFFASEIKALWAAGARKAKRERVWASYFVYGTYGSRQETFWSDIWQLPAGHCLTLHGNSSAIEPWYNFLDTVLAQSDAWRGTAEADVAEHYLALLSESVRLRFRSDVPVGFNVSGGLDSSLLLALINQAFPGNASIEAFTFFTGHHAYDELPWARSMMAMTPYPLNEVQLTPAEIPRLAQKIAHAQDEPFGGLPTLAYSKLFEEARLRGILVLLDGQGLDEAWAGYDYYQKNEAALVQGVTGSPLRPNVLEDDFRQLAEPPSVPVVFTDPLQQMQYRDLFYTKIPRALRFNDRISMLHGTELREPFLDHRLVEFAFSLPSTFKIQRGEGKYFLRKMARTYLPDGLRLAPKRPVQTPQREWLSNELKEWAQHYVNKFALQAGVNRKEVEREWNDFIKRGGDNSFYIWQFINTALLESD
jgi:asparagine synthase (glutamine-hydrolysing)